MTMPSWGDTELHPQMPGSSWNLGIFRLPTNAHWLNPIETPWRWARQDVVGLHRWAADWDTLLKHVHAFLDQYAQGSQAVVRYVGLLRLDT